MTEEVLWSINVLRDTCLRMKTLPAVLARAGLTQNVYVSVFKTVYYVSCFCLFVYTLSLKHYMITD